MAHLNKVVMILAPCNHVAVVTCKTTRNQPGEQLANNRRDSPFCSPNEQASRGTATNTAGCNLQKMI